MEFPPAPPKTSIKIVFVVGAAWARCSAILLDLLSHKSVSHQLIHSLGNWLWSHPKPGIVCHPNSFIVSREHAVSLGKIPSQRKWIILEYHQICLTFGYPKALLVYSGNGGILQVGFLLRPPLQFFVFSSYRLDRYSISQPREDVVSLQMHSLVMHACTVDRL